MADSINTLEDYLKQANLKLDKILFKLDSRLDKCAKSMQIPFDERCALDDIGKIQDSFEEIKERYQNLKAQRDDFEQFYNEKITELENKMVDLN